MPLQGELPLHVQKPTGLRGLLTAVGVLVASIAAIGASAQILTPAARGERPALSLRAAPTKPVDRVLVKLAPGVTPKLMLTRYALTSAVSDAGSGAGKDPASLNLMHANKAIGWTVFRLENAAGLKSALARLKKTPGVILAQPDYRAKLLIAPPNEPFYGTQNWWDLVVVLSQLDNTKSDALQDDVAYWNFTWNLEIINSLAAWDIFPGKYYTAADRVKPSTYLPLIGVIDTGIDMTHPDFSTTGNPAGSAFAYIYQDEATPDPNNAFAIATHDTNVKNGGQLAIDLARSFIDNEYPMDGDGNPDYEHGDPAYAIDGFGHGTSVAGVIGAAANKGYGVPGIAYCAQILPLKAIDNTGSGTEDEIEAAMIYAADHGCVAVNMSLALDTTDYSQAMQDAVNYCWKKGCLVIAAAGNDNDAANPTLGLTHRYPANCERVLAVAASTFASPGDDRTSPGTTIKGEGPASYSNYGPNIGIMAPGGDVTYFNDPTETLTTIGYDPAPQYTLPFTLAPTYLSVLSDPAPGNAEGSYAQLGLYGVDVERNPLHYGAIPGTSLATPHVVGLAGLYAAAYYTNLANQRRKAVPPSPQQIIAAIERGAYSLSGRADGGLASPNTTGYGRIDAAATLFGGNVRRATVGGLVGQVLLGDTVQPNVAISFQACRAGKPIPGAKVYKATSGPDGIYRIANLPTTDPGPAARVPFTYTVSASLNYIDATGHTQKITRKLPSVIVMPGCDQHGIDLVF